MSANSIRSRAGATGLVLALLGALVGMPAHAGEPTSTAEEEPTSVVTEAVDVPPTAAPSDEAASDEAASDEAASDEAASDEAASDEAASDEAAEPAAEPTTAEPDATSDEATTASPQTVTPYDDAVTSAGSVSTATLTVLEDGTPNADGGWDADDSAGNDSGPSNGIVRTQDTVLYQWSYTVATAGDVTLVQTLPDEMVWVTAESTVSCTEGAAAVSADGHTLSCTLTDQTTGGQQYRVRAKVRSGENGQTVTSTLTSGALTSSASLRVSAAPTVKIVTGSDASFGAVEHNGVVGRYVKFRAAFYVPVDSNRGVRGAEALADDGFTLTLDTSSMGADVTQYTTCTSTIAAFTSQPWGNLAGGGTWTCEQDAAAGTITLRASGVVSDLRTYPSNASRAYITGVEVQLWMPAADYTPGDTLALQLTDFNPVSVSGQPNWGADFATPGQAPGAALSPHVNGESFTFSTTEALRYGLSGVYVGNGWGDFASSAPSGSGGTAAGDAPMAPGETFYWGGYVRNNSPTLTDYTDVTICVTWDEDTLNAEGGPQRSTINPNAVGEITGVEYASLDMADDAARRGADCGTSGDGDAAWSSTMDGAGGSTQVNAVRFVLPVLPANMTTSPYFGIPLTRTSTALETRTPLAAFWQVGSDQTGLTRSTFDPTTQGSTSLGSRTLAVGAMVKVTAGWDAATAAQGQSRTFTAQPVITSSSGRATGPLAARDVSLDITVPAGMSVVPNSWLPAATPEVTDNADGSHRYTFALGDLTSEDTDTGVSLDATVDAGVATPSTLTATTTTSSPSDTAARSASASVAVNALATFSATTSVDDAVILPDVPTTLHVLLTNGLSGTAGPGKVVAVLPFDGDGRGTEDVGDVTLTDLSVASGETQVQYSTDTAADVLAATAADLSGDTGVTWRTWPADGSVPDGVTAVRFVFDTLASGDDIQVDLTIAVDELAFGAEVVSDLHGIVSTGGTEVSLDGAARTVLHSGTGRITGTVYHDAGYTWSRDESDAGLADVPVTVAGGVTVRTDADGAFVVDGIVPGAWSLTADGSVAVLDGLMAAEAPGPVEVGIAGDVTAVDFGFVDAIDAPVVVDDTARVAAGSTTTVPVLDNDTVDVSTVITEVGQPADPADGSVAIAADGLSVEYTAPAGSSREVTFTYTVTDQARQSATATVTVSVVAPTAEDATLTVGRSGGTLGLATLVDGVGLTGMTVENGAHGSTSLAGSTVTYTPDAGYAGPDEFTYAVTDAAGTEVSGTITVTVVRGPELADDAAWTTQGTAVAVAVTANDPFVGDGTLTVSTAPSHGTATITGAGEITYTPTAAFLGTDSFTYTVTDAEGQSDSATVTVRVVEVLSVQDDAAETGVSMPVDVDVLANDQGTELAVTEVTEVADGADAQVQADGTVRYTPADGFTGQDTFTYTVADAVGQTASAQVTVTVHAAPEASGLTLRAGTGVAVTGDAGALVTGFGPLSGEVTAQPTDGTLTLAPDGAVTYRSTTGWAGTAVAEITWTDAVGQTVVQQITVEVLAAPTAADHTAAILHGASVDLDLLDGAEGDALTVTRVQTPAGGTMTLDEATGLWTYAATAGYAGLDTFTYTVSDSVGQTATGTVAVTVAALPVAPTLGARTGVAREVVIDPAVQGMIGTVTSVTPRVAGAPGAALTGATQGLAVLNEDGTITFTPAAGFAGTTGFSYRVADALGQSVVGQVEVEVLALTADAVTVTIDGATRTVVDVLAAVQGSAATVTSVGAAGHGTAALVGGQVVYTPVEGWTGTDRFTVLVTDEFGQTVTVTVSAEVTGYTSDVLGTDEGTGASGSGTATSPGTSGGGRLAITGAEAAGLAGFALALVTAGGWLLVTRRRRAAEGGAVPEGAEQD